MDVKLLQRIVVDPAVMCGKPVIRGTRITVEAIRERVAAEMSEAEILEDFPRLTIADISAAMRYR